MADLKEPSGYCLTLPRWPIVGSRPNKGWHRLLDLARSREAGPADRTIDVQVGRLRRKLRLDLKKPTIIKTVHSRGYIPFLISSRIVPSGLV